MLSGLGQNTLGGLMIDTRELVNTRITGWNTESLNISSWLKDDSLNWMNSLLTEGLEFLNTENNNVLLTEQDFQLNWSQENLSTTSWTREL